MTYKFRCYDKYGNLRADYLPCKDSSNNVGMYNVVGGAFCRGVVIRSGGNAMAVGIEIPARMEISEASNYGYVTVPFTATFKKEDGRIVRTADLVFTGADETREVFVGWARKDAGTDMKDWTTVKLADVPAGTAGITVTIPQDIREELYKGRDGLRFFLKGTNTDVTDFLRPVRLGLMLVIR